MREGAMIGDGPKRESEDALPDTGTDGGDPGTRDRYTQRRLKWPPIT